MSTLPPRELQIIRAHGQLIRMVVEAVFQPQRRDELAEVLRVSEQNGWHQLVRVLKRILGGEREMSLLNGLDEEDRVITEAVLRGLQDPTTLPDPSEGADPTSAAPGLAQMIEQASRGDAEALELVAHMAEQMSHAPGDMARLGAIIRSLVNGERDIERLTQGMAPQGRSLVQSIVDELGRTRLH